MQTFSLTHTHTQFPSLHFLTKLPQSRDSRAASSTPQNSLSAVFPPLGSPCLPPLEATNLSPAFSHFLTILQHLSVSPALSLETPPLPVSVPLPGWDRLLPLPLRCRPARCPAWPPSFLSVTPRDFAQDHPTGLVPVVF